MMIDREKVIKGLECCKTYATCNKCPYNGGEQNCNSLRREALALLKEQTHEIWELQELNEYLQDKTNEQKEKPVLDEFGRVFLNALKRQLDMKLQMIELLITPEFAEKIVKLIEQIFD